MVSVAFICYYLHDPNHQPGSVVSWFQVLKGSLPMRNRLICTMLAAVLGCLAQEPAKPISLRDVKRIYIEKMSNDLDQYLRAEIVKQFKGSVTVVLDVKDADGILTGVNDENKGTGAKITGRYLGLHDNATGSLSLVDREGKTLLWSDEAGDRSLLFGALRRGGQRKVADRLIGKLKKAIEQAR
jgi:hypothetical protein